MLQNWMEKNIVLQYIENVLELYAYFHVFLDLVLRKKFCNCLYCCFSISASHLCFGRTNRNFFCMLDILLLQAQVTSIFGKYTIFSILYNKSLSIKSYIYSSRGLCATSEIRIEYLSLKFEGMFGLR